MRQIDQRTEALTAVLNAARALQAAYPNPLGFAGSALVQQLYAAVDAVDAVGERDTEPRRGPCEVCWTIAWAPTPDGETCEHCDLVAAYTRLRAQVADLRGDRPGLCSDPECWRVADLPTGTCHAHSEHAAKPHPWQTAQLRAGVLAPSEEA